MSRVLGPYFAVAAALAVVLSLADARAASDSEELVIESQLVIESFQSDPDMEMYRRHLPDAAGIIIIPSLLKAGFIFGAEGGSGVLLGRNADGSWSYPAFFTLAAGSFGLQIGVEDKEVVFLIMNEAALNAVISHEFKLGVDASITIGNIGGGIEGSTTTALGGDIIAFSRGWGAFAGGAFEGAVIHERVSLARVYYGGAEATARAIVIQGAYANPHADLLRAWLNR